MASYRLLTSSAREFRAGAGAFAAPLVATQFAQQRMWSFHYLISLGIAFSNTALLIAVFRFKDQDSQSFCFSTCASEVPVSHTYAVAHSMSSRDWPGPEQRRTRERGWEQVQADVPATRVASSCLLRPHLHWCRGHSGRYVLVLGVPRSPRLMFVLYDCRLDRHVRERAAWRRPLVRVHRVWFLWW